jgi:hypothetical protein
MSMNTNRHPLHATLVLLTICSVIGTSLLAVGHLLNSRWLDLFLFNGDSLTLALYAKSLFSGEVRDWTFSSQIFFFPEIFIYLLCYALTPTIEWSFILNALINYWLFAFFLYKIAGAVGAAIWVRTGFVVLASCLLLLYCSLEQKAEVNVTALVTLFLFNTYYFGAILCALLIAWLSCCALNGTRFDRKPVYGLVAVCSAMTYFSNPMFLLQGAIPYVLCLLYMRWSRTIENGVSRWLIVAMVLGVVTGQLMRLYFSEHVGKAIGKYVHLKSFLEGLQGVGNNLGRVAETSAGILEFSIIGGLFMLSTVLACVYIRSTARRPAFSITYPGSAFLFLVLFSAFSACITLVGTIVSGNFLMRYFLPIALLPVFVLLTAVLALRAEHGAKGKAYFLVCATLGLAMVTFAWRSSPALGNFSWLSAAPNSESHPGVRCFNELMTKKSFNVVGTFWSTRTLDAYSKTEARALQVNERFEPTLWLNNRDTYRSLKINGVIVSRPTDNVRQKGAIYAEQTHTLGTPESIFTCKDFDIYYYDDNSKGYTQLAEQLKKLKR